MNTQKELIRDSISDLLMENDIDLYLHQIIWLEHSQKHIYSFDP